MILDNGGSVVCWVWWANAYRGGIISPTVDYRPPGTSAIVFELKGPVNVEMPGRQRVVQHVVNRNFGARGWAKGSARSKGLLGSALS